MTTRVYLFPAVLAPPSPRPRRLVRTFPEMTSLANAELGFSLPDWIEARSPAPATSAATLQPIVFTLNVLAFLDRLLEDGRLPQVLAGQGVGEFSALFAAGVFDFPTGLRLVRQLAVDERPPLAHHAARVRGLDLDTLRELLVLAGLAALHLEPTSNPRQFLLSGSAQDLDAVIPVLQGAGAQTDPSSSSSLPAPSQPNPLAAPSLAAALERFPFSPPRIPVLSTATAQPHQPARLKQDLLQSLTHPPRWTECLAWLRRLPEPQFTELGAAPA